jgi:hypothetical protein
MCKFALPKTALTWLEVQRSRSWHIAVGMLHRPRVARKHTRAAAWLRALQR